MNALFILIQVGKHFFNITQFKKTLSRSESGVIIYHKNEKLIKDELPVIHL